MRRRYNFQNITVYSFEKTWDTACEMIKQAVELSIPIWPSNKVTIIDFTICTWPTVWDYLNATKILANSRVVRLNIRIERVYISVSPRINQRSAYFIQSYPIYFNCPQYYTAPYFFLINQNLTWDCLLISVFLPEFAWSEPKIVSFWHSECSDQANTVKFT